MFFYKETFILILDCEFIITPRILFIDKNLTNTDRLVLGLIISLTLKKGFCYASNDYLANYLNLSKRTIGYSLSKLKKFQYIIIKDENNKRRIFLNGIKVPTKVSKGVANNSYQEVAEDCNHNINREYKSKYNNTKEIIPYWMKNPKVCDINVPTNEETEELENILKDFK